MGLRTMKLESGKGIAEYIGKIVDGGYGREFISQIEEGEKIITFRRTTDGAAEIIVRRLEDYDIETAGFKTSGEIGDARNGRLGTDPSLETKCLALKL